MPWHAPILPGFLTLNLWNFRDDKSLHRQLNPKQRNSSIHSVVKQDFCPYMNVPIALRIIIPVQRINPVTGIASGYTFTPSGSGLRLLILTSERFTIE